jgi:hypothetical protein
MLNPLVKIEQTPCDIMYLPNDMCKVTFTIHQQDIYAFQLMFTSLGVLFKNLAWKAKTNIDAIHHRLAANAPKVQTRIEEYEKFVCDTFTDFCGHHTPREAFSLTVSAVKQEYDCSSYDQCKQILTKHKKLKKTGFYKV